MALCQEGDGAQAEPNLPYSKLVVRRLVLTADC